MTNEVKLALLRDSEEGIVSDMPYPVGESPVIPAVRVVPVEEYAGDASDVPIGVIVRAAQSEGYVDMAA